jgi:phospholipid/cholesterol/gamma-HCH transport system substrate-binding protein
MAALSKEVKVGLLALVAGIILYVGFNYLKGIDFFSPTKKYFVVYKNVAGLAASNPVTLNGMTIGRVAQTELLINQKNKILVTLEIDDAIQVGDSSVALLANSSLLGGKEISLVIGNSNKLYSQGDTLRGAIDKNITDIISEKALPVIDNLEQLTGKLNDVFDDKFSNSLKNTMSNFEGASGDLKETLAKSKKNISGITSDLNDLTTSLKETEKKFKPVIAKLDKFADSLNDLELKRVVNNANLAMKNIHEITAKINDSKGSIGMLINDKSLYENLNKSASSLDTLLRHFESNPRYFLKPFGSKPKKKP